LKNPGPQGPGFFVGVVFSGREEHIGRKERIERKEKKVRSVFAIFAFYAAICALRSLRPIALCGHPVFS
jgi:hypothetical protein